MDIRIDSQPHCMKGTTCPSKSVPMSILRSETYAGGVNVGQCIASALFQPKVGMKRKFTQSIFKKKKEIVLFSHMS